jgi:assimilatory nitrate reductase catalytic subunit
MYSKPRFIQGVFPFEGKGMTRPFPLAEAVYTVPAGLRAQLIYFRGGNSTSELIYLVLMRDGKPMRYFPMGAKSDTHIALAVVEDLLSDTKIEVCVAAPEGLQGVAVLDIGLMEI